RTATTEIYTLSLQTLFRSHEVAVLIAEAGGNLPLTGDRCLIGELAPCAESIISRNTLGRVRLPGNLISKDVFVHGRTLLKLCARDRKSTRLNSSHVEI